MLTTITDFSGFSAYHLMHNIPGLPSQRQDRFNLILESMVENKHIKISAKTPNATYYQITEEGRDWYFQLGKKMMKFEESLRN